VVETHCLKTSSGWLYGILQWHITTEERTGEALNSIAETASFEVEGVRFVSLSSLQHGHLQSSHHPNLSLLSTERKQ